MREFQKVAVIGLGYIGLPTAALIASRGMQVIGIDRTRTSSKPLRPAQFISPNRTSMDWCKRSCQAVHWS